MTNKEIYDLNKSGITAEMIAKKYHMTIEMVRYKILKVRDPKYLKKKRVLSKLQKDHNKPKKPEYQPAGKVYFGFSDGWNIRKCERWYYLCFRERLYYTFSGSFKALEMYDRCQTDQGGKPVELFAWNLKY